MRAIAERFALAETATTKNVHLLSFILTEWSAVLVNDIALPIDDDRAFGVTADLGTGFSGCHGFCSSYE